MNVRGRNRRIPGRVAVVAAVFTTFAAGAITYPASADPIAVPRPSLTVDGQRRQSSGNVVVELSYGNLGAGAAISDDGYILRVDASVVGRVLVRTDQGQFTFGCFELGGIQTCEIPLGVDINEVHELEVTLAAETAPRFVLFDSTTTRGLEALANPLVDFG
jgi:hypothetical protein